MVIIIENDNAKLVQQVIGAGVNLDLPIDEVGVTCAMVLLPTTRNSTRSPNAARNHGAHDGRQKTQKFTCGAISRWRCQRGVQRQGEEGKGHGGGGMRAVARVKQF